jgi:hypothetical protein
MDKAIEIKRNLLLPMRMVQIYLTLSVLLYFAGPLKWPTQNPLLLLVFLLLAQLSLYLGYRCSIRRLNSEVDSSSEVASPSFLIKAAIVVSSVYLAFFLIRYSGVEALRVGALIEKMRTALENPAIAYAEKWDIEHFGGKLLTYSAIALSPLWWSALPLSLMYFKKLGAIFKIMALWIILVTPFSALATGTNKGVVDWIIIIASIVFIKSLGKRNDGLLQPPGRKVRKRALGIIVVAIVLITLAVAVFSFNIGARIGSHWDTPEFSTGIVPIDFDSLAMRLCPSGLQPTLVYLASYIDQGYYALSLAFPLPWTPTLGAGSSGFIKINVLREMLGIDISPYTYQGKMEKRYGWLAGRNWPSIYLDFANDVHFVGVIFLLFLLGFFFAEIVKDAVVHKRPVAIVILCLLFMAFIYFPANNQIGNSGYTFVPFFILSICWAMRRMFRRNANSLVAGQEQNDMPAPE